MVELDIVIPAHNEEQLLPACLRSILSGAASIRLRVIVAANGCSDDTVRVARSFATMANSRRHELVVLDSRTTGKVDALNAADRYRRDCAVIYLDADTVLLPGTLQALAGELAYSVQPRLVAPPFVLVRPKMRLTRDFAAVWSRLPNVAHDVIGAGCYAVNAAGRRRWGDFPRVIADDLFVRGLFQPDERLVTDSGGYLLVLPESGELVQVLRRWRRGNIQLQRRDETQGSGRAWTPRPQSRSSGMRSLLRLGLWPHLPGFAAVTLASRRAVSSADGPDTGWERAIRLRRSEGGGRPDETPLSSLRVDVVVVTHQSRNDITKCLDSLRSRMAELDVTVIDNASSDGTATLVETEFPTARLLRNTMNLGFGRAVNQAAAYGEGSHLLLVNPDVEVTSDGLDELFTLAMRFPDACLYGGRAVHADGTLDPTCCLARPSLWQAVAFALGFSALPGMSRLDPDALSGWHRDDVRAVQVLTGALLLVERKLWRQLGGFDDRYFMYGEDVDLCIRAAQRGKRAMFSHRAVYRHTGGGSSTAEQRNISILKAKMTLCDEHLGSWRRSLAQFAVLFGVGIRALAELLTGARRRGRAHSWAKAWACRKEWKHGWQRGCLGSDSSRTLRAADGGLADALPGAAYGTRTDDRWAR